MPSRRAAVRLTTQALSDLLRDFYPTPEYNRKKAQAKADFYGIHVDVVLVAIGWKVTPPAHSARDRRIAKNIARNWVGTKVPIDLVKLIYKNSQLLALLPKPELKPKTCTPSLIWR